MAALLTPFGVKMRHLRLDYGMNMTDLAKDIGVSPAYLSNVEHGKKPVNKQFVDRVYEAMGLTDQERSQLNKAAIDSQPVITIDSTRLTEQQANLARLFAWKLPAFTPEKIEKARAILEDDR